MEIGVDLAREAPIGLLMSSADADLERPRI
jgi:hypothetical protein